MSDTAIIGDKADVLEQRWSEKTAGSAHAFVRGDTIQHYMLLNELPPLPDGPPIWICGDCHVGNLGPIADRDGHVDFQIRDLDQNDWQSRARHRPTGPVAGQRCAEFGSPGAMTARIVESVLEGYTVRQNALDDHEPAKEPITVASVRREALGRKWHHLANERLGDVRPTIPLGRKFWELSEDERWSIGTLLDSPDVKTLILTLNKRSERAKVELVDAAYWMKGCSSLGKVRYAALVHLSGERKDKLSLVDIKEAGPAAAPSATGVDIPGDHAERIVAGARTLSPNLGDRMASGSIGARPVIIRELMPEDLKLEMEQFSRKEAVTAARYLAMVVGKAHGRQMKRDDRARWGADIGGRHSTSDAPSWLWTTLVPLLTRHEAAYLEHCRLIERRLSEHADGVAP